MRRPDRKAPKQAVIYSTPHARRVSIFRPPWKKR